MDNPLRATLPHVTIKIETEFYAGKLYILYDASTKVKEFMQALHDMGFRYINGLSQIDMPLDNWGFYVFRFVPERQAIKGYRLGDYIECPDLPRPVPFYLIAV